MSDHAVDIDKHVRIYITVFVALMVLTIVTVMISRLHLPVHTAVTVALVVASIGCRLKEIQRREEEDPDQIHEMPEEARVLDPVGEPLGV